MSPFLLRKWYLDCVTGTGNAAIVYAAEMHWHGLPVRYASALLRVDGRVSTQTSMRNCSLPSAEDDQNIHVELAALELAGNWTADSPAVGATVYASGDGAVEWSCLQPRSRVELNVGGERFEGLGYAECLTLTLPPWKLPMRELRWGRFISATDAVSWIDWRGEYSTTLAFHNGERVTPSQITESEVRWAGGELELSGATTLRAGALRDSVLPAAPKLAKLLPDSLFGIREQKWLSRGLCRTPESNSTGWTIHEVVHWNL